MQGYSHVLDRTYASRNNVLQQRYHAAERFPAVLTISPVADTLAFNLAILWNDSLGLTVIMLFPIIRFNA